MDDEGDNFITIGQEISLENGLIIEKIMEK